MGDALRRVSQMAIAEAQVPNLRSRCTKEVVWAGEPDTQTDFVVVYVHGFSATKAEVRPLPDLVAQALGAHLFLTRLTGHGQDGAAMGEATLQDWRADMVEVAEMAALLGKKVILMGCSTGCPLIVSALADGVIARESVVGVVCCSPNFGLRHKVAQLVLDMPLSHIWGPWIAGAQRSFDPISPEHEAFWTLRYPIKSVRPMGQAVRAARAVDAAAIHVPAFVALNADDQVISPKRARAVMGRWGGDVMWYPLIQTPQDDKMGHVMAGDVLSPGQTKPLAAAIVAWAQNL